MNEFSGDYVISAAIQRRLERAEPRTRVMVADLIRALANRGIVTEIPPSERTTYLNFYPAQQAKRKRFGCIEIGTARVHVDVHGVLERRASELGMVLKGSPSNRYAVQRVHSQTDLEAVLRLAA